LFHTFDFAPAKNFVEKKSHRQHGVPAHPARGTSEYPHLTPALSPPSDGAEREKRSPLLWNNLRLDLPDGHPQNQKRELPFLLPGGEGQDEGGRKTIIHFSETPNCAGRKPALPFQSEWLTKSKLPPMERVQKNSVSR
jgi:hypothetical protein